MIIIDHTQTFKRGHTWAYDFHIIFKMSVQFSAINVNLYKEKEDVEKISEQHEMNILLLNT